MGHGTRQQAALSQASAGRGSDFLIGGGAGVSSRRPSIAISEVASHATLLGILGMPDLLLPPGVTGCLPGSLLVGVFLDEAHFPTLDTSVVTSLCPLFVVAPVVPVPNYRPSEMVVVLPKPLTTALLTALLAHPRVRPVL
eukprot:RCo039680